jgi:hypothetical protein
LHTVIAIVAYVGQQLSHRFDKELAFIGDLAGGIADGVGDVAAAGGSALGMDSPKTSKKTPTSSTADTASSGSLL